MPYKLGHLDPRARQAQARYRAANRAVLNQKHRDYHAANKSKQRSYYQRNKFHLKLKHSDNHRRLKYGMTKVEFEALRVSQGNQCAICERSFNDCKPHVDHSHLSGQVRGLLCHTCNVGLGNFRDNPHLLVNAIEYLSCHQEPTQPSESHRASAAQLSML